MTRLQFLWIASKSFSLIPIPTCYISGISMVMLVVD